MPIRSAIVNATNLQRSLDFYTEFLDARIVGKPTASRAVLDFLSGTVELRAVDGATASTWIPDDLQKGFRHIGFKVDAVDPRAEVLKAAEVPFHLDPLNAEGGVRICFFFDPDGTLLEFVEGDLHYATVLDPDGVARERAMGVPRRPRLDHIAVTVEDRGGTEQFYRERFNFSFIGTIEQPSDPRGFSIGYLKSGDMVLEVFTYEAAKQERAPQLDAPGFAYAELIGGVLAGLPRIAAVDGRPIYVDADGFIFAIGEG
ncbi:MAG TPA: VOC family protein [Propionibacteriaceae bacterium]|nr:VOC family protein [Propionibacteriaceae bacterium]